jgi:hypothetical protein
VAAGVASTALLLAGVPGAEAQETSGTGTVRTADTFKAAPASGKAKVMKTVTLVTGDQVMLDGAGKVTGVVRGEGREKVAFSVRDVDGHTRVVPGDAELLLAQGRLDARLFDVTQLVADGYDDAGRGDVPLIVTFRGKKAPSMSPFTGAGAKVGRALPVVNGKAMRPVKKRGADFWNAVTGSGGKADEAAEFTDPTRPRNVSRNHLVRARVHDLREEWEQADAEIARAREFAGTSGATTYDLEIDDLAAESAWRRGDIEAARQGWDRLAETFYTLAHPRYDRYRARLSELPPVPR